MTLNFYFQKQPPTVAPQNVWNNNFIKYKSSAVRNKNLSAKEYLDKINPYLRDIINLQKS